MVVLIKCDVWVKFLECMDNEFHQIPKLEIRENHGTSGVFKSRQKLTDSLVLI